MEKQFDFNDLFVFEMANNHQGRIEHGVGIIQAMGALARKHAIRAAVKFQFRDLDSFIHPAHQKASDNKHIPRFLSTRLDEPSFQTLFDAVRAEGLLTMCTPFDEPSAERIARMGFDIIKVASCSNRDWPLLEAIAATNLPVIFSTGGAELRDVDNLVSFFDHRGSDYAMMHCVSLYPMPQELAFMNQIELFRNRYPGRVVGWSTHEAPDDLMPVQIAVAKGARMFEKHVGMTAEDIKLNAYSATPEQVDAWLDTWKRANALCGTGPRIVTEPERVAIDELQRGVFARRPIKAGEVIARDAVYFAMPLQPGQMISGAWKEGMVANVDVAVDEAVPAGGAARTENPDVRVLKNAIHDVKALLNEARIALSSEFEVEYSHHYGIANFPEFGAVIVTCINREYCKKILVQLPGQKHPPHYHKLKEETFQVLYGDLTVNVEGRIRKMLPGDTCLVLPGVWHSFWTDGGCVFEEVSTTHHNNDSVYKDAKINQLERHERKTVVDHWGRFQIAARSGS